MQPVSKNKQYFPQISNPPTEIMADLSYKFKKQNSFYFCFLPLARYKGFFSKKKKNIRVFFICNHINTSKVFVFIFNLSKILVNFQIET
jgi:hypothetical protein